MGYGEDEPYGDGQYKGEEPVQMGRHFEAMVLIFPVEELLEEDDE